MARSKNVFSPWSQSAPKPNSEKLDERKGGNEDKKGQPQPKQKERRIGRTALNWTGNDLPTTTPEISTKNEKKFFTSSFDFRNEEDSSSKTRKGRCRSAPYFSADHDDVFINSSVEHEKLVRKSDVDLSILQTVANANDHDTVSNKSGSDMGSQDKKETGGLLRPCMERNGFKDNSSLNSSRKACYISTSHSNEETRNGFDRPRPKSILSNRVKSAPQSKTKKVYIVDRPKSCYYDRFAESALKKFNENFRPRAISSRDYLPRRSFFSCHDNVLVGAGINPRDLTSLDDKRRPRICDDNNGSETSTEEVNEYGEDQHEGIANPSEDTSKNNEATESEMVNMQNIGNCSDQERPQVKARSISATSIDNLSQLTDTASEYDRESLSNSHASWSVAMKVTGVIAKMRQKSRKRSTNTRTRKKSHEHEEYDSKHIKVDPRPIVDYLKLVKEKPEEYLAMKNQTRKTGVGSTDNLVSMGRAFNKGSSLSLVAQAAYELGSRTQPKIIQRYEAEKAKLGKKKMSSVSRPQSSTSSRPQSSTSTRSPKASTVQNPKFKLQHGVTAISALNALSGSSTQETDTTGSNSNANSSNGWAELRAQMTDVERKRAEVEHWLKKMSTGQIVKAREMALKELGEESSSIRRWWLSHRYCRYLRQRKHANEDYV